MCSIVAIAAFDWTPLAFASAAVCALESALGVCAIQALCAGNNAVVLPTAGFSVALAFGCAGFACSRCEGATCALHSRIIAVALGLVPFLLASLVLVAPFAALALPLLTQYVIVPLIVALLLAHLTASFVIASFQYLFKAIFTKVLQ